MESTPEKNDAGGKGVQGKTRTSYNTAILGCRGRKARKDELVMDTETPDNSNSVMGVRQLELLQFARGCSHNFDVDGSCEVGGWRGWSEFRASRWSSYFRGLSLS